MPHRRNSNLKNQSIPNSQTRNCCEGTYRMQQINPIIPAGKKKKSNFFFKHKGRVKLCARLLPKAKLPPNGQRNDSQASGEMLSLNWLPAGNNVTRKWRNDRDLYKKELLFCQVDPQNEPHRASLLCCGLRNQRNRKFLIHLSKIQQSLSKN